MKARKFLLKTRRKVQKMTFSRQYLVELAGSSAVYDRASIYSKDRRVTALNVSGTQVRSTVKGKKLYSTYIEMGSDGAVEDYYCSCPSYESSGEACKHILATLMSLEKVDLGRQVNIFRQGKPPVQSGRSARALIEGISMASFEEAPEELDIEVFLEEEDGFDTTTSLRIRSGKEKMHFEKSMEEFLDKWSEGLIKADKPYDELFEYLYSIYLALSVPSEPYVRSKTVTRGDRFLLSPQMMKKVLRILNGETIHYTGPFAGGMTGVRKEPVLIAEVSPKISYSISEKSGNLSLRVKLDKGCHFLDETAAVFHEPGILGIVPDRELKTIRTINSTILQKEDGGFLSIPTDLRDTFLSSVLPELGRTGQVVLDGALQEKIITEELRPEVYLDIHEDSITAKLKFRYGDYTVRENNDTLVRDNLGNEILMKETGIVIVRDIPREEGIMSVFEDCEFRLFMDHMYLDGDEEIWLFLTKGLPLLKERAEVYYSDDFRKITTKGSSSPGISLSSKDGASYLEFSFDLPDGLSSHELLEILGSSKDGRKYHRLKDGTFIDTLDSSLKALSEVVTNLGLKEKDLMDGSISVPMSRALYLEEALKDTGIQFSKDAHVSEMIARIRDPKSFDFKVPASYKSILRDYQKTGVKWMKALESSGLCGILADDMGLGKTLQVITLIDSGDKSRPSLVVAPTSLVYNWKAEIEKFGPGLRVLVVDGSRKTRETLVTLAGEHDIVLTSYPLVRKDQDLYADMDFNYCILDEAQHIKNPVTSAAKSVKSIKSRYRLAMTGTPVENTLTELWSIFDFLMPGYLGSHRKFLERYEKPITTDGDKDALRNLVSHVKPFILRRLKKDVLKELPDKIETRLLLDMDESQKKVYVAKLSEAKKEITGETRHSHIKILSLLTRLRQTCNHPALIIDGYKGRSAKLDALVELVDESIKGGHKVLVFSQFTSMLAIIRRELEANGHPCLYLDGGVDSRDRIGLVNSFQNGEKNIFLISLKAGGTGLNLTEADVVVHFDPWWNPAVEDQATDRAYRIGQKNKVQVYRFITAGTIEEKIVSLQERKKDMVDSVIKPGETILGKLTEKEIEGLFS